MQLLDNFFLKIVLATLAGAMGTLALAPFGYWPLAIVSIALLYGLLETLRKTPKLFFLLAFIYGLALFGSGASWVYVSIHEFGYLPVPLAALLTIIFCAGLAAANATVLSLYLLSEKANLALSWQSAVVFSAIATLADSSRTWLFSGFPWLIQGYALTESPFGGLASILGVFGLSLMIYLTGTLGLCIARTARLNIQPTSQTQQNSATQHQPAQTIHSRQMVIPVLCLLLLWSTSFACSKINWTQAQSSPQSVSMIQANISQHNKWRPEWRKRTLDLYQQLTVGELSANHLILWPEAAIPLYLNHADHYLSDLAVKARTKNAAVLLGIPSRDSNGAIYNSVTTLGMSEGIYHKSHLVPFGEYIPFQNFFGALMEVFDLPLSGMTAGKRDQNPIEIFNWKSQPLICYEIVFPNQTAQAARSSDVLITVSNDSWFGKSLGPLQHLQMAQMRAVENGRYVLRSTGSGVSAIINEKGKLVAQSKQFQEEVLRGNFELMAGETPWTTFGYWLIHVIYSVLALGGLLHMRVTQSL